MTHDDDCVRLHLLVGTRLIPCNALGLEWPPPERLTSLNGTDFSDDPLVRVRMSDLTDEQADHPNVARCAEYVYEKSDR